MTWSARVVEPDGTVVVANLDGVTVGPVRWTLNRPTTGSVTVPTVADGLDELVSPDGVTVREVQVFRGADLMLWGFPVGVEWGPQTTSVQLADPLWLLGRRYVGRLEDVNLITNGSFETGDFTGWTTSSVDTPTVDASVNALDGSYVARLDSSLNPPSVNKAAVQDFTVGTLTEPTTYIATGYVWVDPLTGLTQTDYELGLVCQLFNASATLIDEWWQKVDTGTDTSFWTRLSVPITVPAHSGDWTLRVALASPQGVLFWDAIRLVKVERLAYLGTDQTAIAEGLVEHAQDPTVGKADLGILTDCPATGIPRARVYSYAEHENILDALVELAETTYGFDFEMVCTTTTKTFTTHYPSKGSTTSVADFVWGTNISEWSMSTDLSQAAGSVSVLGEGTTDSEGRADDREHQWAVDTVAHSGRRLELLEDAPARANTSEMRDRAEELLESQACPNVLTLTVHRTDADDWADKIASGLLEVGDTVHVTIDHGPVQVDADYRITELELDPVTETIKPVLNLARSLVS